VWTLGAAGRRVAAPIRRVASVPAIGHMIVEVTLDDGRAGRASAGHPPPGGRSLGGLAPGDPLDGARVVAVRTLPCDGERTFDLLPAGATGVDRADGVPLGSTLAP
jgi:hypothetical protein